MLRRFLAIAAVIAAVVGLTAPGYAAKDTLVIGMVLEPPHLDPTGGAAAAIDAVFQCQVGTAYRLGQLQADDGQRAFEPVGGGLIASLQRSPCLDSH